MGGLCTAAFFMALLCQFVSLLFPKIHNTRSQCSSALRAVGPATCVWRSTELSTHCRNFHTGLQGCSHTPPFGCHCRVWAGTELFPSAIPAAQVPLRIATRKKLKENFEGNQGLSVNIELCPLFPFWERYMTTRCRTEFISLLFHIHCPRKMRTKALC